MLAHSNVAMYPGKNTIAGDIIDGLIYPLLTIDKSSAEYNFHSRII